MYDANVGRWLTRDPKKQYWSPYEGMGNDPINGVDPDGGFFGDNDPPGTSSVRTNGQSPVMPNSGHDYNGEAGPYVNDPRTPAPGNVYRGTDFNPSTAPLPNQLQGANNPANWHSGSTDPDHTIESILFPFAPKGAGVGFQSIARVGVISNVSRVPAYARIIANYVGKTGRVLNGYAGGRTFQNDGRGGGQALPKLDPNGKSIIYKEYDVHPQVQGVNRGAERVVIGSDGNKYYTNDHYNTFTQIQ
jgi:hypothetical protein